MFFSEEKGTDTDGNLLLERENGSGAVVQGINLEGKIIPLQNLRFQMGLTFQKASIKKLQQWSDNVNVLPQKGCFARPDTYGYLTANYQVVKNMNISLSEPIREACWCNILPDI